MIYQGEAISVRLASNGLARLVFDLSGETINKFNGQTLDELKRAADALAAAADIKGLVVSSAKNCFIVGADITEFGSLFSASEEKIVHWLAEANAIFNQIEDLTFPSVTAINGIALGGGFEMCLATDYRVMATTAKVGLPEVKLGIFPGFGGTVRLSRLIGADNAIEWIASGSEKGADVALREGAVDALAEPERLIEVAETLLHHAIEGRLDYRKRRAEKKNKLRLISPLEHMMCFETAKAYVSAKAGKHYPAPVTAIKAIQKHAYLERDQALLVEAKSFAKMAKTEVSANLVKLFLNDQLLKKKAKSQADLAVPIKQAAVLGAGIMGGGIAYQSALKGIPILMKDIQPSGLSAGLKEVNKHVQARVDRGQMNSSAAGEVLTRIAPTLSFGDFRQVDLVVEAVVENLQVKQAVYAELESYLPTDSVIASNTSSISVNALASQLQHPERFCGMHFFNPVHKMPLVEIIRAQKTSDKTIATVVEYARAIGKTPIVVNDCPGFLVNRVLFPYFGGFAALLKEGADFQVIDRVMEAFGWPMGPAYLLDVIGLDTAAHAGKVMAEGFPERMQYTFKSAAEKLFDSKRLGQKNGLGFYCYEMVKKGKSKKVIDNSVYDLLSEVCDPVQSVNDDEIIARLMIPMCIETVRCLEESIVETPAEADMGLIYGLGFPPFRGGPLLYIDTLGMDKFIAMTETYAHLGSLYQPTEAMQEMANNGKKYFN